jgi:tRNA dimethylallyltransferase
MSGINKTILILGVTASGKARLAHEIAKAIGGEVISIDSMKVYRRMDIGTAKPSPAARTEIPYHLIDVVEPGEPFSVGRYLELAAKAAADIRSRNKPVIFAGGTAMYIKALLYGLFEGAGTDESIRDELKARIDSQGIAALHGELASKDPAAAARIHPNDSKRIIRALEVIALTGKPITDHQQQWESPVPRPLPDWTIIGLSREKPDASHRINARVKRMFDEGLVDEVRSLLAEPLPLSQQARCAIGYAEVIDHLAGKHSLEDTIELVKKNTRRMAKSQRTWFKTFRGVNWLEAAPDEPLQSLLERAMRLLEPPQ